MFNEIQPSSATIVLVDMVHDDKGAAEISISILSNCQSMLLHWAVSQLCQRKITSRGDLSKRSKGEGKGKEEEGKGEMEMGSIH